MIKLKSYQRLRLAPEPTQAKRPIRLRQASDRDDFKYPNGIGPGVYDIHSPNKGIDQLHVGARRFDRDDVRVHVRNPGNDVVTSHLGVTFYGVEDGAGKQH